VNVLFLVVSFFSCLVLWPVLAHGFAFDFLLKILNFIIVWLASLRIAEYESSVMLTFIFKMEVLLIFSANI
jgi:hypothetical protein